jgi:phosphatidylinositol kinase/protein kinase (PI-3  family)
MQDLHTAFVEFYDAIGPRYIGRKRKYEEFSSAFFSLPERPDPKEKESIVLNLIDSFLSKREIFPAESALHSALLSLKKSMCPQSLDDLPSSVPQANSLMR